MTPAEFKAARLKLGLSGPQIASAMGVDTRTLWRYESHDANNIPGPVAALMRLWLWLHEQGVTPPDWPENGRAGKAGNPNLKRI